MNVYHLNVHGITVINIVNMKTNTSTIIQIVLIILSAYLTCIMYHEQFTIMVQLKGNQNILYNPYLNGLLVYYIITFMSKSKLIVPPVSKEKKILVYMAPVFVLTLAITNYISLNINSVQIVSIVNGIVFPEFLLGFIHIFEPNFQLKFENIS